MKVVCDQCAAVYRVPDTRLKKPVNKATCRQCGSRLLIPKPKADADPEARVVVTAVPPRKPMGDGVVVAPKVEVDSDKTIPMVEQSALPDATVGDIPTLSGTSLRDAERKRLDDAWSPRATSVDISPGEEDDAWPPEDDPVVAVAVIGTGIALVGLLILLFASDPSWRTSGLFLASAGAFSAMFAMVTADLSIKAPKPAVSMGLGSALAALLTLGLLVLSPQQTQGSRRVQADDIVISDPEPRTVADNRYGDDDAAAALPDDFSDEAPHDGPVRQEPEPRPRSVETTTTRTPAPKPEPKPVRQAPKPAPKPAAKVEVEEPTPPTPAPKPRRATKPTRTAPPKATTSKVDDESISPAVLKTIIETNLAVKRCFFDAIRDGSLRRPAIVSTAFRLSSSGKASRFHIVDPPSQVGSDLESCLVTAFRGMSFPPGARDETVNYPFHLN